MVTGPPATRHVAMGLAIAKADNRAFNTDLVDVSEDTYARRKY